MHMLNPQDKAAHSTLCTLTSHVYTLRCWCSSGLSGRFLFTAGVVSKATGCGQIEPQKYLLGKLVHRVAEWVQKVRIYNV